MTRGTPTGDLTRRVELRVIEVELRRPFRHAGYTRTHSRNLQVLVEERSRCDTRRGWGEGLPREYVTGETEEQALACFREHGDRVAALGLEALGSALDGTPALRCALELALLDVIGQRRGLPLTSMLPQGPPPSGAAVTQHAVRYSGILGGDDRGRLRRQAALLRLWGFRAVKLKVGLDAAEDLDRVALARRVLGSRISLRLDANGAWEPDEAITLLQRMKPHGVVAVEEPVRPGDLEGAAEVGRRAGLPVVLDESLRGEADVRHAHEAGVPAILNLRLSKLGGLTRTWRVAEAGRRAGLRLQLGCQVGETGLLSAAGRAFALRCGGDLCFAEGSYDRHLLRQLPTRPDVTFGYGGRGRALLRPGLGVAPGAEGGRDVTPGGEPLVASATGCSVEPG